MSPSAAMAPLTPSTITPARLRPAFHSPLPRCEGARPPAHQAVSVRHASRVSVLTRCADKEYARAVEGFCATCSSSTSAAPSSASEIRNTADSAAPRRTACPGGNARNAHTASSATSTRSIPLVTRCVYSISVNTLGEAGTTSPLHSGQWFPQPAPAPVARTYAPHSTTATL